MHTLRAIVTGIVSSLSIAAPCVAQPRGYPPPPEGYQQPPPGGYRQPASAEVRFEADEPGVELLGASGAVPYVRYGYRRWWGYRRFGWAQTYTPICEQPCATRFGLGPHHLALSKDGGPAVPSDEPVVVQGPSLLRASYTDRSALRVTGWVIGISGVVGGIVMIAASTRSELFCDPSGLCYRQDTTSGPLLAGGIALIVAASIAGGVLASQRDHAHISVEPLRLSWHGGEREAALPNGWAQGAALALHY